MYRFTGRLFARNAVFGKGIVFLTISWVMLWVIAYVTGGVEFEKWMQFPIVVTTIIAFVIPFMYGFFLLTSREARRDYDD